jgi:hypothetical protein
LQSSFIFSLWLFSLFTIILLLFAFIISTLLC